jgi:hypothetical protein
MQESPMTSAGSFLIRQSKAILARSCEAGSAGVETLLFWLAREQIHYNRGEDSREDRLQEEFL